MKTTQLEIDGVILNVYYEYEPATKGDYWTPPTPPRVDILKIEVALTLQLHDFLRDVIIEQEEELYWHHVDDVINERRGK